MKKVVALAASFLAVVLAGCSHPRPVVVYAPPPAYSAVAQQGFHDGMRAAQNDIHRGLRPDADRHPRFRNPPVAPPLQADYRHGFHEGYERVIHGGPAPGY